MPAEQVFGTTGMSATAAVVELVKAVAWPLFFGVVLWRYKYSIRRLIATALKFFRQVDEVGIGSLSFKRLQKEAAERAAVSTAEEASTLKQRIDDPSTDSDERARLTELLMHKTAEAERYRQLAERLENPPTSPPTFDLPWRSKVPVFEYILFKRTTDWIIVGLGPKWILERAMAAEFDAIKAKVADLVSTYSARRSMKAHDIQDGINLHVRDGNLSATGEPSNSYVQVLIQAAAGTLNQD